MARCLAWCDLSKIQIADIEKCKDRKSLEQFLSKVLDLPKYDSDIRQGILLDLYLGVLRFATSLALDPERMSTLFSLVKVNHFKAVKEHLTLEKSFAYFKKLLLEHSVQRPPYSVSLFSFQAVKDITDWVIDTYYRHYKLYQYAFTERFTLDVKETSILVETPPTLVPLADALNSRKWAEHEEELARQAAEQHAQEQADAEAAAEAARLAALDEEYQNAIPDEISARVHKVLEEKMALLKEEMEAQFKQQEENLLEKISALENQGKRPDSKGTSKK
mmetsp:Transcript_44370/g.73953  ORF Transcript_44370/g.73953 Transcript_44370/m.73953 type:complete len:276 (+) Transcript_44370:252-1079(+)|eukprot:CAMPEP_0198201444 /NCGR_PEP_ID=MMETSP1445-20131203/4298_1 /TAXON_ID=36898 /ORGANISM="Pyramimonas sp., Strain CCMP2087" /LENGTH=275 /DNA_ID=CAMNT_0043871803 /DNA_START=250 /DNA_END=1077 /DNA_ORIENTATION=-